MSQPLWATQERQSQLVKFAMKYKGVCLEGHPLCPEIEHYTLVFSKSEAAWTRKASTTTICRRIVEAHTSTPGLMRRSPQRVVVEREELSDLYGQVEERAIDAWKVEDREARRFDGRTPDRFGKLRENLAPTGEIGRFGAFHLVGRRSSYDPVDIDQFVNQRPRYYLKGYGVDDQLRRFARIQIPGTTVILKIDISLGIQELSKRRRKSLRRTGIKLQFTEQIILAAVAQWWG